MFVLPFPDFVFNNIPLVIFAVIFIVVVVAYLYFYQRRSQPKSAPTESTENDANVLPNTLGDAEISCDKDGQCSVAI